MAKRVRGWQGAKPYTLFVPDGNLGEECTPVIVQNQTIIEGQTLSAQGGTLTRYAYNVDPANTTFGPIVNLNPDGTAATRAELDLIPIVSQTITAATDEFPPFEIQIELGNLGGLPTSPQSYGIPIINPNGCTSYLEFLIGADTSPGVL